MSGPFISRRRLLDLAAGATASAVVSRGLCGSSAHAQNRTRAETNEGLPSRPNMVLFMPDELRADALGCYGNSIVQTPNFDRVAAEGTLFSNCHVQFPVCTQSRCSIMTGWPANARGHRSLYYPLQGNEPNMFRYLREAGYDTYWFGKNDLLTPDAFADSVTCWSDVPATYSHYRPAPTPEAPDATTFLYQPLPDDPRLTWDYSLVAKAIDVLKQSEHERPFCIFLPIFQPHPPYAAPRSFHEMYALSDIPPLVPPGLAGRPGFHDALRAEYGLADVSEETLRKIRAIYLGQVSYTDWLLGELLDGMERSGRNSDTALFILSDHGDYTGDYGLVEKWPNGLEDALTHIPLIARVPGGARAHRVDAMVEAYDIMPTCLELAGTQARHTHFAQSLLPELAGGEGDSQRAAFTSGGHNPDETQAFDKMDDVPQVYRPKARLMNTAPRFLARAESIRTRQYKLILRPRGVSELYDCIEDPQLRYNRFDDPALAEVQDELDDRLTDHLIETSGVTPLKRDPRGMPPFTTTEG